jgi:hypothetical protein
LAAARCSASSRQDATPAQVALAWVLRQDGVIAIPKASSIDHVRDNRGALDIRLTKDDRADLDEAFPPPTKPTPARNALTLPSLKSGCHGYRLKTKGAGAATAASAPVRQRMLRHFADEGPQPGQF